YAPAANYNGPDVIAYTIQDNGTTDGAPDPLTASATVAVTVTPVNDAPHLIVPTSAPVVKTTTATFAFGATDVESTQFSYALVGATYGATINPVTGVFTWTPSEDQGPGAFTFHVKVTDD